MKKYAFIPVVTIVAAVLQYFFPWWTMPIACATIAFLMKVPAARAYASGFGAIFALWYVMSMIADLQFDTPMSSILGGIFGGISSNLVYTLTAFVGGLVAGFASLTGSLAHSMVSPK
jgi:uncharacterized membrane protein YjjB (DUF3815 family)